MRVLLPIAVVMLVSACGGEADRPNSGPSATLRVSHVLDPNAKALFMEGSIWHLRVLDSRGDAVLDRRLVDNSVSVRLHEGRYRLESEELPCDGNCSHLDPATDGCSTEFDVQAGASLTGKVTLEPAEGCKAVVRA